MKQTDGRKDTARGLKAFFAGARVFKGGYASLLTAGVIVLAILVNILSGYLEDRFALTRSVSGQCTTRHWAGMVSPFSCAEKRS